jgi:hypothetical protein
MHFSEPAQWVQFSGLRILLVLVVRPCFANMLGGCSGRLGFRIQNSGFGSYIHITVILFGFRGHARVRAANGGIASILLTPGLPRLKVLEEVVPR